MNEKHAREVRRWKKELQLSGKREKDWRSNSEKLVKRYRGEEKKRNRYNVLWANTEIFRAAYYNSKPNPDVRRRFRDADPLGKAVSEVLERSLYFLVDGDSVDNAIKNDVLDALLPGRGVSRVRYVPQLAPSGQTAPVVSAPTSTDQDDGDRTRIDGELEQVEFEQAVIEHVDWKDFRHGYGRTWEEVPWTGFRHKLTKADAEKSLGASAIKGIVFAVPTTEDEKKQEEVGETERVAEFWEIWDKEGERVFFLHDSVEELLFPKDTPKGDAPLELEGFFPCPRPLHFVENTGSLLPIPPFHLYEEQAEELDRISQRIDRIVKVCRLRAIYDAKVEEIADLLSADDNEMIPIQNAQQWAASGGLEKAIAWMPIDQLKDVLSALYDARTRQKEIIDELSGVMDIMRGASDPNETYGAQQIKANYGSVRLKRPQDEVKRYARDLLRLASQVMCSKFAPDTFATMTDLNFPTAQQKQQLQAHIQMQQQRQTMLPPASGHPINPAVLQLPSWEDLIGMMRSPAMRQFRVDVETDSTIAGSLESDMAGLSQLLKAISETMQGLAPLVESGSLPVESAKEIVMAVIRRARLGNAVEDAFDKMQAPKPKPDPKAAAAQVKADADIHIAQVKAQLDAHVAQIQQQAQSAQNAQEQQLEAQRTAQKQQFDMAQAKLDSAVKIIVATITATKAPDSAVQPRADKDVVSGLQ